MKYLVVTFILFICTLQTFCQQEYFVYLQTDNNQAFYVRLNNKVYSSTSSGYLLLTNIGDNPVAITIGFAKNVSPEQQFNISASHKDAGYIIKNFDEKGWGLSNLQTQAVTMNSNPPVEKKNLEITGSKKTDDFSLLLSNAVNDTAVLYTVNKPKKIIAAPEIAVVEEKKKDTVVTAPKETIPIKDTVALVKNEPAKKDSSFTAKVIAKPDTIDNVPVSKTISPVVKKTDTVDTASVTKTVSPVVKKPDTVDTSSVTKTVSAIVKEEPAPEKIQEKHDSVAVVKNTNSTTTNSNSSPIPKITNSIKNLFGLGKSEAKPRKDTIIIIDTNATAKNTDKKDAIIIMPGNGAEKTVSKNTTAPNENKPPVVPTITKDSVISETVKKQRPAVAKTAELLTDTSYVAIFVDGSEGKFDTIRISIPFKEAPASVAKNKPVVKEAKPADSIGKIKKDSPVVVTEQPVLVTKKDTTAATVTDTGKTAKTTSLSVNSDCKEAAFDIDVDKLRIKMMQAVSDEEKIAQAKKVYRLKCFSVKQVRALSELFKTDEGKYRWFDAVYPFVSDNNNFSSLSELIKNEYYLSRFKAMLRN